jgi:2-methylcitrate dehydratase
MAGTTVQCLARWVRDYDVSKIPEHAVALIKHSILDSIGCAIVSLAEPCVQGVLAYARSAGGAPQASLIGGGKTTLPLAALVNGTLVRAIDYNDHLAMDPNDGAKLGGHPSDNLASVLAVSEWRDASGREMVNALLLAYELYGRVYRFLRPDLPWDHTTAFGFSVPAAAARLMHLDVDTTGNAIAISAAQSASLGAVRRGQLSHSKFLAGALVAERGVQAALLATAGVTGPMTVFEDSRGICQGIFGTSEGMERLFAPLPPLHMVEGVTIKSFPGMDTSQAAIEAAVTAARARKLTADEISSVELVMNDHPMTRQQARDPERRSPHSRETADHSFYYLVAVALLDGELTPRQFHEGRWFDPEVLAVMNRITIRADAAWNDRAPGGFPCTLRLTTVNGHEEVVEVAFAAGHARNRMTRAQVVDKFCRNVDGKIDRVRCDEIIAAVDELDSLRSVRDLTALLS